jgi:transcriptional regulator with XRE-family HTH domain
MHSWSRELGSRIRVLRLSAGLTQFDLAAAAGLSRTSVTNIEAGRQDPDVVTWSRIARRLNVSVEDLVTGLGEGVRVVDWAQALRSRRPRRRV